MQIDANFINDLYDFLKGTDREDRLGPERACAQGWNHYKSHESGDYTHNPCVWNRRVKPAILWRNRNDSRRNCVYSLCLSLHCRSLSTGISWMGRCIGTYLFRHRSGWMYFLCNGTRMEHRWALASIACGLVIDTLLMVNNFRDREQDTLSGKRTLVVRLGARAGLILYFLLGMVACWCCVYFIMIGKIYAALLPQIYLIPHILTTQRMAKINRGKQLNSILGETSRNMLLFGMLLTLGLVL